MTNRVPLIVNSSAFQIQELPLTDTLSVAGNVIAGNVSATGNVSASYVLGNGSALTGIVNSSGETTYTATQTFNGSSSTAAMKTLNITEISNVIASAPAATTNFYINSGAVQYYTANANANFTLNFAFSSGTSLNTAMANNDSISCALLVTNGATPYYPSAYTVDGSSVTPKWQGGTAPSSGDASAVDSYGFVIIKTATSTYTILASQTKFS